MTHQCFLIFNRLYPVRNPLHRRKYPGLVDFLSLQLRTEITPAHLIFLMKKKTLSCSFQCCLQSSKDMWYQQVFSAIDLKRVLTVERDIFNESQSFLLPERKQTSLRQCLFDWNEMSLDDILFIHEIDFNDLYEQWKKSICQSRHHEQCSTLSKGSLKDSIPSSCDCQSEVNVDHHQPIDEFQLNGSRSSLKTESIIIDKANEYLTSERLTEDEQLASDTNRRTSLFKLDKSTSMPSLPSPMIEKTTSDLFLIEQNSSPNRSRHEHWITTSMNAYPHPFANHWHERKKRSELTIEMINWIVSFLFFLSFEKNNWSTYHTWTCLWSNQWLKITSLQ